MTRQCRDSRRLAARSAASTRHDRGFALVAALIVLVLLSSIGAAMLRLTAVERAAATGAILGARANWAAQSGVEWASHQASSAGSCGSGTLVLTEGALAGFQVVVSCTETTHREGGQTVRSLSIRSEARFGTYGTPDFVFREIQAGLTL